MRPRSDERGKASTYEGYGLSTAASMRPRSDERGKNTASGATTAGVALQGGRARMSAESGAVVPAGDRRAGFNEAALG